MKQEMQMLMEPPKVEICETCQSGQHGCQHYFCMCDCRYPLPWRGGATVTHNTILDANGETVAYDVISATRPSVIRERILRAVNNHDALIETLRAAHTWLAGLAMMHNFNGQEALITQIDAALTAAQEQVNET